MVLRDTVFMLVGHGALFPLQLLKVKM